MITMSRNATRFKSYLQDCAHCSIKFLKKFYPVSQKGNELSRTLVISFCQNQRLYEHI